MSADQATGRPRREASACMTAASSRSVTPGRIARSTRAVLYALHGQTGDVLWSSGNEIASWNHYSGISVANGRVYIGTYDGVVYCFGLPEAEHLK
jgi:outer membrane protein assembly factor BamB